jgi:CO/xanthine dehydrogenase FAD-binding subunit
LEFLQPTSFHEALELKAERPEALPLAGGTDVMVDLNFDRHRPATILDLGRVVELGEWAHDGGRIRLGAGVTYTRLVAETSRSLPGLAIASRTIGSPQIRNRATVAGNLGTSSPAGDALPPLLACAAEIEIASATETRTLAFKDFMLGPKENALRRDELIAAVLIPTARGPQQFSKIGTRNAMVISVASVALAIDAERHRVSTAIGSAGPVILDARDADTFIAGVLDEQGSWERRGPLPEAALKNFGALVAGAAMPIDDVRGTRVYRRHAIAVMARRTLAWAWDEYTGAT